MILSRHASGAPTRMIDGRDWLTGLAERLPRHAEVVGNLRDAVETSDQWRWLVVSCSLGAGRGDEHSDIDAGVGYSQALTIEELERSGSDLKQKLTLHSRSR